MKSLFFIIVVLLPGLSFAEKVKLSNNDVILKKGSKSLVFSRDQVDMFLISKTCNITKDCLANKALTKSLKLSNEKKSPQGGKNPGSLVCSRIEGAQVVILKDLKGNEQSFCEFTDKSAISTGILFQKYKDQL